MPISPVQQKQGKTELVVCGIPFDTPTAQDALAKARDHGFTSVQIYTFWSDFEGAAQGVFDFGSLDKKVELIRSAGLKFVPFILMGPKYAAPAWWLAHPNHVGLRCLEHGRESPIESVWNPLFRCEISRVLEQFASQYLPWNVLESVQPGICGDYGEALFPAVGNWPGDYHTHRGFWCNGPDARESFRNYCQTHYSSIDALNRAWCSNYKGFTDIQPFLPHRTPSRTALFDLIAWYRWSMTEYAEFWMAECQRLFPGVSAYLCTGGSDDEITSGALFAAQAKIAGKHQGGIRLTNEGNKFSYNFPITAHTWAACRHYNAYYGLEPVGPMTEAGVRTRMFGSAAFGNRQIFHYYGNLFDRESRPQPAAASVKQYAHLIGEKSVERGIAFFWPIDQALFPGSGLSGDVTPGLLHVRRKYPVSPVSEELIMDNVLDSHKCLVMLGAISTRAEVLQKIACWVRDKNGILLAAGLCRDIELELVPEFCDIFGIKPDSEEACGHCTQHIKAPEGFSHLGKIAGFHVEKSWLGLARDVETIAAAVPGPGMGMQRDTRTHATSAIFKRVHPGGGLAIFYSGDVVFQRDPEALHADPGVFPALLDDVCAMSGIVPFSPGEGDIACARVGSQFLTLRENTILIG